MVAEEGVALCENSFDGDDVLVLGFSEGVSFELLRIVDDGFGDGEGFEVAACAFVDPEFAGSLLLHFVPILNVLGFEQDS